MRWLLHSPLLLLILLSMSGMPQANELSAEELERWFNTDSLDPPRYKEVNDGHLVFLGNKSTKGLHHHHNAVTILPNSTVDGWILIEQCHSNIDKVPAAQILFKKGRVKDLKVVSSKNIEKAWVEGDSVQMENIKQDAQLCVQAFSNSLKHNTDGTYSLRNGPFMRRFLDGYFPLYVSFVLTYPQSDLELINFTPDIQSGFKVKQAAGRVMIDTVFEGRLTTEFLFKPKAL